MSAIPLYPETPALARARATYALSLLTEGVPVCDPDIEWLIAQIYWDGQACEDTDPKAAVAAYRQSELMAHTQSDRFEAAIAKALR